MRATFDRLPERGYKDNPTVDALLSFYDEKLALVADKASNFWRLVSPDYPLNPYADKNSNKPVADYAPYNASADAAGYTFTVNRPTVFSIKSEYLASDRGTAHRIQILDTANGSTVWERSFKASARHDFTGIALPAGQYFVSASYGTGIPVTTAKTSVIRTKYGTLNTAFQEAYSDGAISSPRTGNCTPLAIAEQTPEERLHEKALDYTAYLVGLTGQYWSKSWDSGIKRNVLRAVSMLQQWRGTEKGLRAALDAQEVVYDIWGGASSLQLSFTLPAKFGSLQPSVFVRLPLTSDRKSREYTEAQRAVVNYASVANVSICYDAFYLGYSTIGEPVFGGNT